MLNFNQFRIFYYAAKNLNFTRAAQELFISQPAVTIQIKAFEAYCGLKLFKKRGRRNWLTDEGQALFNYAKTVFAIEKEIENTLDDMRKLKRGLLKIATTKAYARYFMPLMLSSFHAKYPDIKIELNEGSSLDMTRSLLDFKNEVGIIAKAAEVPGIQLIPFSREEMVMVLAPRRFTPVRTSSKAALINPGISTPECSKKWSSSAARKAFTSTGETASILTGVRRLSPNSARIRRSRE